MLYSRLVQVYEEVSATTKRTAMTRTLVELLRETPPELVHLIVYLTQGKLYPEFVPVEMGMAERLALQAVVEATGISGEQVRSDLTATGDLGRTAEALLGREREQVGRLTVEEVYGRLDAIARAAGKGSVADKVALLADLLREASPEEAKYLVRTATGKLRLGLADMTLLDALAIAYGGGKGARRDLERAYSLSSDLGEVATSVAKGGMAAVRRFQIQPGRPLRPMLAQRLPSPETILKKLGGRCRAEYKYDGERLQIHKIGDRVMLFSRRLEEITHQYPDAIRWVLNGVRADEAILDSEAVALNPDTGELLPFQQLMHRRRKHGVTEKASQYPVFVYPFDILYRDGTDLTGVSFRERREILEEVVQPSEGLQPMPGRTVESLEVLNEYFQEALDAGCEGLICKSIKPGSVYQAGSRGWNWIKFKREYVSEMTDTVDLVVVGALHGRGKRGGGYGSLLLSAYDPATDSFPTATKCGAGFTDQDLAELPRRLAPYRIDHRHPRVNARMKPDVWFTPALVLEVLGAEITLSPSITS